MLVTVMTEFCAVACTVWSMPQKKIPLKIPMCGETRQCTNKSKTRERKWMIKICLICNKNTSLYYYCVRIRSKSSSRLAHPTIKSPLLFSFISGQEVTNFLIN